MGVIYFVIDNLTNQEPLISQFFFRLKVNLLAVNDEISSSSGCNFSYGICSHIALAHINCTEFELLGINVMHWVVNKKTTLEQQICCIHYGSFSKS